MSGFDSLLWVAVGACFATLVSGVVGWRRQRWGLTQGFGWLAVSLVTGLWSIRWLQAGHLPLFGTFESALSLASFVLWAGAIADARTGERGRIVALAAAVAGVFLVHGGTFSRETYALTISERSWVVDVHAFAAWSAFAILALNLAFSVELLAGGERNGRLERSLRWGFLLHTAMLATGSLYKFLLFGESWSFDPIETLAMVAWLSYGTLLHLHLLAGWRGRRLATWCVGLFLILVISYRGIVYFPAWSTYHIFDMDLRMHVTGRELQEGGP